MTCLYYQKIASETYIDNGNTHYTFRKKQANKTVTCHHAMPQVTYTSCMLHVYALSISK